MITSIFSKSKPINFTIVFFITLFGFVFANIKAGIDSYAFLFVFQKAFIFVIFYLSILMLNFIVGKNNLTLKNNYEILFYSLFLLMLPQVFVHDRIIISNFFVLLALRRLLSLHSQIDIKKKLFDTSFWIAIATLFYFWAILFFILIYAVLILFTDNKIKNWIVPFAGIGTVLLISVSYSIIKFDGFFDAIDISLKTSYDFISYNSPKYIIALTIMFSFGIWASIFYLRSMKKKTKKYRPVFKAVFIMLMIAFAIVVMAPDKNGSEFLFLFAPLAIILTNYVETIQEKWFKELFLFILIATPIALLML